jgi:hypothetical protein
MKTLTLLVFAVALIAVASAAADEPTPLARGAAYPNAVAVIGDADATGYASDTRHPFQEARANSWATGTNPSARSIYSRLLAVNPTIKGRAFNFASHGAALKDLPSQVRKVIARTIKPELVLVQIMESDITCDGKDETRYTDYQARTTAALQTLAKGLPKARILAVSEWGTLDSYIKAVQSYGLAARLTHAGKGACSIFAPKTGKVVPEHVSYIRRMTNGYHAVFAAACEAVPTCRYDGGAARRDRAEAGRPGTSVRAPVGSGTGEARCRRMEGAVRELDPAELRRPFGWNSRVGGAGVGGVGRVVTMVTLAVRSGSLGFGRG